jgi:malto-oligosyltrehalose synthase/4-alpha-glucanotransferase
MNPINSTYRFQFHKDFTFEHARQLVPYLDQLGVKTLYASPVFEAVKDSMHGYDGIDPTAINPQIGGLDQLKMLSDKLKEKQIGWLQDIVPNHMAFHPSNRWMMDVLEKGGRSAYAQFFDISPTSKLFEGKVMVPFLGSDLDEAIREGNLVLEADEEKMYLKYMEAAYPVCAESYLAILQSELQTDKLGAIMASIETLLKLDDPEAFSKEWESVQAQFKAAGGLGKLLASTIKDVNANPKEIKALADQQHYVLCKFSTTDQQINFRRFFTVNDLICLNIQNEPVFRTCHSLISSLVEQGVFQGLRIDHIDGLFDPKAYLQNLRAVTGDETYLTVEKILENSEELPTDWAVQGNTGYDFLAKVNNLLSNNKAEEKLTGFYENLTESSQQADEILLEKKRLILYDHMGGEYDNLFNLLFKLELVDDETLARVGKDPLKKGLGEFLVYFPVYRYYASSFPLSDQETAQISDILQKAETGFPELTNALDVLRQVLLVHPLSSDQAGRDNVLEFYQRCMQFTGPLMAKGVEDTLMYTYNRFIGHNDVGGSLEQFGMTPEAFHRSMVHRQKNWPLTMNATSTHDTKRGEDVRARLNVLTDLADLWIRKVTTWFDIHGDLHAPDKNDQYLIYQTIVGAYPMPGEPDADFADRLSAYLQKALREAKRKTNWTSPDEQYEAAAQDFAAKLLDKNGRFWESFSDFHTKVADYGITNSIAQLLLKFTCPGIPDVYQGCELWDLSLVDPDNRKSVDYHLRQQVLDGFSGRDADSLITSLWDERNNGHVKMWLTHHLLVHRRANQAFFRYAEYKPLEVKGAFKDHIIAFYRVHRGQVMLVVVPLNTAILCEEQQTDILHLDWQKTKILLPDYLNTNWKNLFSGEENTWQKEIDVQQLFSKIPLVILTGTQQPSERKAGILAHVTSLPSAFGIGDLGPEAYRFADFLHLSYQKIWQMLPVNPVDSDMGFSPYSSLSSMAAEPMLISPERLQAQGLLNEEELDKFRLPQTEQTDYPRVQQNKEKLLKMAYARFCKGEGELDGAAFNKFREENADWLQDHALFVALREKFGQKPWTGWEAAYRSRDPKVMADFAEQHEDEIRYHQWLQYVFGEQWSALRQYCSDREITLFGDLPFYVSANSSDVWAHQDLFMLDQEGNATSKAGVPPDQFSETGQLWGMPVFNWDAHKNDNYKWWTKRLARNVSIYDLVRLDHFRAFADYWAVDADQKTAENGEWMQGPGEDFFNAVKEALGGLPFVAEDLGEITPPVFKLRDQFGLPGMKVLQFAFGLDLGKSLYIPHNFDANFLVYTGTHDNNTTIGWLREQSDPLVQESLNQYFSQEVSEKNINRLFAAAAYGSVAKTAILPVQDILDLDEKSRLNSPGSEQGNWAWRMIPGQLTEAVQTRLRELTRFYNRI